MHDSGSTATNSRTSPHHRRAKPEWEVAGCSIAARLLLPGADLETEDHFETPQGSMAKGQKQQCCLFLAGNMGDGRAKRTCFVKTYDLTKACLAARWWEESGAEDPKS